MFAPLDLNELKRDSTERKDGISSPSRGRVGEESERERWMERRGWRKNQEPFVEIAGLMEHVLLSLSLSHIFQVSAFT